MIDWIKEWVNEWLSEGESVYTYKLCLEYMDNLYILWKIKSLV